MRPCNADVLDAFPDYDVNRRDADVPLLGRLSQLRRSVSGSLLPSYFPAHSVLSMSP